MVFKCETFFEDALEPTLEDLSIGELIPKGQHKDDNCEVEGHTVLVVWVDVLLSESCTVVGLFHRNEHDEQIKEAHEQWVQFQLTHHRPGELVIKLVLADKPAQEQPFINPIQNDQC